MSVLWQLEYQGEKRPLAQWGIESQSLDMYNGALDTLTLRLAKASAYNNAPFAFRERIVLWRDSVRVFHGVVTQLPFAEKASGARRECIISGPWWWLENIVFGQERYVLNDARRPDLGFAAQPVTTPRAVMYQGQDGEAATAGAQAQVAATYAANKAGQLYNGDAPFTRGTFDIPLLAPWEETRNISCAEVIRRCMRWSRDAVAYWDYSGVKPQLEIKRRANLAAVTLDLDDADAIEDYSVGSRPDLIPRGVILFFEKAVTVPPSGTPNTNPAAGSQFSEYSEQRAGPHPDHGVQNLISVLRLSGSGDGAEEEPPGLALAYYNSLADLQWEGRVILREVDPAIALKPGVVLNLDGGDTEWATMRAVVQQVTVDVAARTTTVEFGPAEQLGPQDLLDQVRLQKGEGGGDGGQSRFEGTPPGGPQNNRSSPPSTPPGGSQPNSGTYNAKEIEICEGGQRKKIKVSLT
jgi:hypothetical protein